MLANIDYMYGDKIKQYRVFQLLSEYNRLNYPFTSENRKNKNSLETTDLCDLKEL